MYNLVSYRLNEVVESASFLSHEIGSLATKCGIRLKLHTLGSSPDATGSILHWYD